MLHVSCRGLKLYCTTPGLDSMIVPGAETSGPEAHEHGADEFAKGGGVHGFQLGLLAVQEVMTVESTARKTYTFSCLVVIHQPLHLKTEDSRWLKSNH